MVYYGWFLQQGGLSLMMDQHTRICNDCDYEVSYMRISDAHDPETVTQFVATMLEGKLAGLSAVTSKCPQCKNELTLESTTKKLVIRINKPHECSASEVNLPGIDTDLATVVRKASIDQKELWQLVPNLELEAEGRSGWEDNAFICYEKGLWLVGGPSNGSRSWYAVDCFTGHIIRTDDFLNKKELHFIDDAAVLSVAPELDAQIVVDYLQDHIQEYENPPSYYSDEQWEKNRKWREEIREKHDLREDFYREKIVVCGCKNCERILESLS